MTIDELFGSSTVKTVLSPMAGYTDVAFRSICKSFGATLTVTEMVSSKALVMHNDNTETLLHRESNDDNCSVQIFGHEPSVMAESVQLDCLKNFDAVDINMGCPVRKIVSNGDGSALLENPQQAYRVISAVRKVWDKPLSVKFRLGVSDDSKAVSFAKMCADAGADFITVHFRTRNQMYSGNADFTLLPEIVKCGIPVIANGDVTTKQDYLRLVENGAYGVAIGRGALGKPYLFSQLADKDYSFDLLQTVKLQASILGKHFGARVVANEMKKHIAFYLKGKRGAKSVIVAVNLSSDVDEMIALVEKFLQGGVTND